MDMLDIAIHQVVHSSPDSAREYAQQIGRSYQVFINKTNPGGEGGDLNIHEFRALLLASGNLFPLEVLADQLGVKIVPKDEKKPVSLLEAVMEASAEHGDVLRKVKEITSDNRVTDREKLELSKEIKEAQRALDALALTVEAGSTIN